MADILECQAALEWLYDQHFAESHEVPEQTREPDGTVDIALVQKALDCIPSDDYKIWIDIGLALTAGGLNFETWLNWSKKSAKFDHDVCVDKWETFKPKKIKLGTVFHYAQRYGFRFAVAFAELGRQDHTIFRFDEIGNSQRFVKYFGDVVIWVSAMRAWMVWDGRRWVKDQTETVLGYGKETARKIFLEVAACADDDQRKRIASWAHTSSCLKAVKGMLELAKPDLAITVDKLDSDQFKLNCMNGTIDLRTGFLMPHNPRDYITKLVSVAYKPQAKAPRWESFLDKIFGGNALVIEFVQNMLGNCITGDVSEQVLPVAHGDGENGKSTLFNAVRDLMGEYAQEADPSLIVAKDSRGATPEVARLKGARLVTTIETNEGVRLDEARVKQLTGGDRLTARYLNCNPFEFDPTHKIWIVTNHLPEIRSQSHAIWRRIRLIPFTVKIEKHLKDKHLADKLRAEYEGILAWLVRGCLQWQEEGLPEPPEVMNATRTYQTEQDSLERFIADRCRLNPTGKVQSSTLRNEYKYWCKSNGEFEFNRNALTKRLREKGFVDKPEKGCTMWWGLEPLWSLSAQIAG